MLDRYLAVELAGGSTTIARKHAKASLDLANELQHERTAAFRKAALCAEATASVVNIVAILSGVRRLHTRRSEQGSASAMARNAPESSVGSR